MTARYPTKRATSAGGLVYADRPDGRWVVLIAHRDTSGRLQWTLPKGGLEGSEDLKAAAVREVLEETGLEAEITAKLGVVDYWFVWKPDQVRYHKFVHYFLMAHRGGDLRHRDEEAADVMWMPIHYAVTRLSHANERRLVLDAHPELEPDRADSDAPGVRAAEPAEGGERSGVRAAEPAEGGERSGVRAAEPAEGGERSGVRAAEPAEGGERSGVRAAEPAEGGERSGVRAAEPPEGGERSGVRAAEPPEGGERSGVRAAEPPEGWERSG